MRISDWSSDVCSSDLHHRYGRTVLAQAAVHMAADGRARHHTPDHIQRGQAVLRMHPLDKVQPDQVLRSIAPERLGPPIDPHETSLAIDRADVVVRVVEDRDRKTTSLNSSQYCDIR